LALRQITVIWDTARGDLAPPDKASWAHLDMALWDWIHPQSAEGGEPAPEEVGLEMQGFARRVLEDLVPLSDSSPGLRSGIARLAGQLATGLEVEVKLDPTFELLYPVDYGGANPAAREAWKVQLRRLADEWLARTPEAIAKLIAGYEEEADRIGYSSPRGSQEVSRRLAEATANPEVLLEALERVELPETFVAPFLRRLVRERRVGWEEAALHLLESDRYRFAAIDEILCLPDSPPSLLEKALDQAAAWPERVETLALCRELPPKSLRSALLHSDPNLALAAAVGEWSPNTASGPREEYRLEWRAALLRAPTDIDSTGPQSWVGEILAQDPDLALDWLTARLRDPEPATYAGTHAWTRALAALSQEQRSRLLREVRPLPILSSLLPPLVKGDPELYRQLLQRSELRDFHLSPLSEKPGNSWSELAKLALEAGHSAERIAEAATWNAYLSGQPHDYPPISFWTEMRDGFEALEAPADARLHAVLKEGARIAQEELQRAEEQLEQIGLRGV